MNLKNPYFNLFQFFGHLCGHSVLFETQRGGKKSTWFTWGVCKKSMMIHIGGGGSQKYPKNDPHGL